MFFSRYVFVVCFIFIPLFSASAQVVISEIMYDLDGADEDREWIEIQNTGNTEVDISSWKFYEGASNHGLTLSQGTPSLLPGAFAVIVDSPNNFLSDNAGFSGAIFDSSFSLSNTGEILAIRDGTLVDIDSLTYSSDWGAKGDGSSLQKVGGVWVAGAPTPGATNAGSAESGASASTENTSSNTSSSSQTYSTGGGASLIEQTIFPNAGPDKTVIAGATVVFEGEALGIKKEPLLNARFVWNFGDGETAEGKKVSHTYRYPGENIVVLNVASDERSVSDKAVVTVTESRVSISAVLSGEDGYVEIANSSLNEVDISWWQISDGLKVFIIPSGTLILSSKKVRFANSITKLAPNEENAALYYPSGKAAYQYSNSKLTPLSPILVPVSLEQKVAKNVPTKRAVKEVEKVEEISAGFKNQQAASVAEAASPLGEINENGKWYLALFGLVALALGGVIFVANKKKDASGFTIVE